eukprot:TRINITY_DN21126_c0_g1_i1.p1 TRINITY_DN21126_c0_g1~~TRINITY_DN21126_c0_g1_i1.p1  ORF type:complete len:367 (+),score=42.73 TRINITY_DN21126_c0_g1_i1:50-1102(+)
MGLEELKARPDDEVALAPKAPGSFQRGACRVQRWITSDGASSEFPCEAGRYHLFVNYGCGWCHQVMITRSLKKLDNIVSMSHVGCYRVGQRGTPDYGGWVIPPGCDPTGNDFRCARDIYNCADATYGTDQLTIPILFDRVSKRVVSNDPAHIILMLDQIFESSAPPLYPSHLREQIEAMNAVIYPGINDGVYRCWFGGMRDPDSPAFNEGFQAVQSTLKWLETDVLGKEDNPFLLSGSDTITLADVRAFPHLFRFDGIYQELMLRKRGSKLGGGDFPLLMAWLRRLFEMPDIRRTCDLQFATRFYFSSLDATECDAIYARERFAWMPDIEELNAKRQAEGMNVQLLQMKP